jgi:thiol-disulfide isomerase/thioredoxin
MSTRTIIGLAVALPAAFVVFLVLTASGPSKDGMGPKEAAAGCTKAAPDCLPVIDFVDSNREVHSGESLKGKVVVVNFWATWCTPCKREIPAFNRVYEEYRDKGVEFFGVLQEDPYDPHAVLNFASDHEMTYPIGPIDDTIARNFGVAEAIPTTFVYDRKGQRVENHLGPLEDYELRAILDKLLAE